MFGRSYFGAAYFAGGMFGAQVSDAVSDAAPTSPSAQAPAASSYGGNWHRFAPAESTARCSSIAQQNLAAIMALMHAAAAGALECR